MTEGPHGVGPSLAAKRELALEAKDIIESKAFEAVKAELKEALVNELMTTQSPQRQGDIIAELRVLDRTLGQFKALINDYNAGVRAQQRGGARA